MSNVAKTSTLRVILPKSLAERTVTALGPFGKADTQEIVLSTGGLTTEIVVRYIKDYAKLRDEFGQTFRQLGIERQPESATPELSKLRTGYSEAEGLISEARGAFQKLQAELERVDRQVLDLEKQLASVDQIRATEFSYELLASLATGFRRILGRMPFKKLEPAQKALRALLKDETIMSTGARKNDWVYLLVFTPTDEASQTLQTLLLYDFIQTEMPKIDGSSLEDVLTNWNSKKNALTLEKESLGTRLEGLRKSLAGPLNRSTDQVEETLLVLRGSLRLGEGARVAHIFARLDKPAAPAILDALQRDGVVEQD